MYIPPVIEREFRTALRRHASGRSRYITALSAAALVILFMLFGMAVAPRSWGPMLHEFLFYGGLFLAVAPAAQVSTALFSEERRNQTMGLLYLTGTGPGELFFGKLAAGLLVASGELLALVPFLAVPFLSGGISLHLYFATIVCLPAVLLFTVSVGALASVLCGDEGSSFSCAALIAGVLCLAGPLPYNLGRMMVGKAPFSSAWLCLSPAYGPFIIVHHYFGAAEGRLWWNTLITLGWSVLCLVLAALLLRRSWQAEIQGETAAGWRHALRSWIRGDAAGRKAQRERLLSENPYQWLVEQDRNPLMLAWAILAGTGILWLLAWWMWPRVWPSPVMLFSTALLWIICVQAVMAYAAGRRIGTERGDGVLELLLTTPLSPRQMVSGQIAGLRSQFRVMQFTLLGLCVLMMAGGFLVRKWNEPAVVVYVVIWMVLFYLCFRDARRIAPPAMWIAANSARPMFSVFRLRGGKWIWFNFFWNARNLMHVFNGGSFAFPSGSAIEVAIVSTAAFIVFIVLIAENATQHKLESRLISEMRSIAQEPVPAVNDPRFKKWNILERLPAN